MPAMRGGSHSPASAVRWWCCPRCDGEGLTGRPGDQYRYQCREGIERPGARTWTGRIHKGWLPAREVAELRAAEAAEAV